MSLRLVASHTSIVAFSSVVAGWMVALEGEEGEKVLQAHSFSLREQDDGCMSRTMGQADGVALGERVGAQLFFYQRGI
jgi:hypothetical protein